MYQPDLHTCVIPGNQEMSHLCHPSYQPMPDFPITSIMTQNSEVNEYGSGDGMDSSEYDSSYDEDERDQELFIHVPTTQPTTTESPVMRLIAQQLQRITQLIEALQRKQDEKDKEPTPAQLNSVVAQSDIAAENYQQPSTQNWQQSPPQNGQNWNQIPSQHAQNWQHAPSQGMQQHWQQPPNPQNLPPDGSIPQDHVQQILTQQYNLQDLSNDPNKILSLGHGQHQYVTYNEYKDSILPVLQGAPVQVLPCTAGLRQPNITDCTRYYVCNRASATVFMFECPRETAFNRDTRMCTASEYDRCKRPNANNLMLMMSQLQQSFQRPIQYIQHEPIQEQYIRPQIIRPLPPQIIQQQPVQIVQGPQAPNTQKNQNILKLEEKVEQSTPKPQIRCTQLGKLPDPKSIYDYYVCYRTKSGEIEGHKMTCQTPLRFCSINSVCTTNDRCV